MPKKKLKENDGSIPDSVVRTLYEFCPGGFCLFYFNQETGQPEQAVNFDSPAHVLALQKYISDFNEAIHQVNIDNCINNIHRIFGGEDDDDNSSKDA